MKPVAIAALALILPYAPLTADSVADFYKSKQFTIVVGSTTGGTYDVYGRLLSRHIGAHIPGNPRIIVENCEGASGLIAINYVANVAPRDGSVVIAALSSAPTAPLMTPDAAKFDATKLTWIGSVTKEPFVGYVWHTAKAQSFEDLKTIETYMGGNSVGGAGVDMAIMSNAMFGTKMKIVTGYPGSAETKIALEKGEIEGTFANSWGALKSRMDWLNEKKVKVVVQHGFTRHKEMPDVPLFMDQAKTEADRQALTLMLARQEFAKPVFAPPGVPPERVEALRRAFDATMADPKFLAEAARLNASVDEPMTGEQLTQMVNEIARTPRPVVDRVQKMLADFVASKR